VLYVSGEESGEQIALRARRLSLDTGSCKLLAEINLERSCRRCRRRSRRSR
jgi:DNA repair protein RadA/Sms